MKKILVVFHSRRGTTKKYAEAITKELIDQKHDVECISINSYSLQQALEADMILLGCWTSGLFLFLQHPEKVWKLFAQQLPELHEKPVGFFTTYKLTTGSMFNNMAKALGSKVESISLKLKSKTGELSENDKKKLSLFAS